MTAREEELTARMLLERQELIGVYWKERRWSALAALVRYARKDVPVELAQTDPALYRMLREQLTKFWVNGGRIFSLEKLEAISG